MGKADETINGSVVHHDTDSGVRIITVKESVATRVLSWILAFAVMSMVAYLIYVDKTLDELKVFAGRGDRYTSEQGHAIEARVVKLESQAPSEYPPTPYVLSVDKRFDKLEGLIEDNRKMLTTLLVRGHVE